MERSFKEEVAKLKLGEGETFHGEGILAVTKALLQSGVSYVGGYQGAPVSHVMDVLNDARDILDELGVHVETNANEAGAAAMLGASINYPMRGAVAFKSTVGTNVASDALSNLASAGVVPVGYTAPEEHEQGIRKATEAYLGVVQKAARTAGVPCEVMSETSDYPADAIVAAAKKRRCDLIFIASHGRRGEKGGDARPQRFREPHAGFRGGVGELGAVGGNQDVLKHKGAPR